MDIKKCFKVLQLNENASAEEIRKAYKRLVPLYHPDKNKSPEASEKFKQIYEAYNTLTNIKGNESKFSFNNNDDVYYFNDDYFSKKSSNWFSFFFTNNSNNTFDNIDGFHRPGGNTNKNYDNFNERVQKEMTFKNLHVTLEEISVGTVKNVVLAYNDIDGKIIKKKLKINIHPGWKEGTRITFQKEGVSFIVKIKPHPIFQRDGANLIYVASITLRDALCGNYSNNTFSSSCRKILVPVSLDGKEKIQIKLKNDEIIKPQTTKILQGLGLPFSNNVQQRGDIIVKFDIQFPSTLTRNMVIGIAKLLDNYDYRDSNEERDLKRDRDWLWNGVGGKKKDKGEEKMDTN